MPHNFANAKRCFEEESRGESRRGEETPVHVLASDDDDDDDVLHWTMEAGLRGRMRERVWE